MTASTFIFVHDQYIVLDYLAAGKFNELPDVKYVFLGQRPTDQIEHLVDMGKVIIARNLPDNIEHFPNLVAWTGWYAVVKNGFVTADVVNLFEYDVNIVGEWVQPYENTNYFPYHATDEVWWNFHGIQQMIEDNIYEKRSEFNAVNVPMTSNYTLEADSLEAFASWSFPYAMHPQAGHIVERVCSYFFEGIETNDKALTHLYADSHGTQGRGDRYQEIKSKLL